MGLFDVGTGVPCSGIGTGAVEFGVDICTGAVAAAAGAGAGVIVPELFEFLDNELTFFPNLPWKIGYVGLIVAVVFIIDSLGVGQAWV